MNIILKNDISDIGLILNSVHTRNLPEDEENFTALKDKGYIARDPTEGKGISLA